MQKREFTNRCTALATAVLGLNACDQLLETARLAPAARRARHRPGPAPPALDLRHEAAIGTGESALSKGSERLTGMSEVDDLAETGLETINDNSARWTLPVLMGGPRPILGRRDGHGSRGRYQPWVKAWPTERRAPSGRQASDCSTR
jgi:hypothetical protein